MVPLSLKKISNVYLSFSFLNDKAEVISSHRLTWGSKMKYHLSNKPGLEQNRSRVKCYHFSIIPLSHHEVTLHPGLSLSPWSYIHYICSVSLSRPESHERHGCQGGWKLRSLFWADMCCPKYSVTIKKRECGGTTWWLCCIIWVFFLFCCCFSPLFSLGTGYWRVNKITLSESRNTYPTLLCLADKTHLLL